MYYIPNVKYKILQDNVGENLSNSGYGNDFLVNITNNMICK